MHRLRCSGKGFQERHLRSSERERQSAEKDRKHNPAPRLAGRSEETRQSDHPRSGVSNSWRHHIAKGAQAERPPRAPHSAIRGTREKLEFVLDALRGKEAAARKRETKSVWFDSAEDCENKLPRPSIDPLREIRAAVSDSCCTASESEWPLIRHVRSYPIDPA